MTKKGATNKPRGCNRRWEQPAADADARDMVVRRTRAGRTQVRWQRGDAFCQDRQDAFFARLSETCNIAEAARHVNTTRQTVLLWRRKDKEFAERYRLVLADAHADLQMRLIAMVRDGVTGEQWEEQGKDGIVRLRFRRDNPGQIRMVLQQHEARQQQASEDVAEEPERAPRETLDELIDRLRTRIGEMEAAEAAKHGARG